jgi:hypothetical protein
MQKNNFPPAHWTNSTMSDTQIIDTVLDRNRHDGTRLVQILREIQEQLGWLSPATLTHIADGIGWPRAQVSGTAAFYSFFHTRQRGKYCVLWSDNITLRGRGGAGFSTGLKWEACRKAAGHGAIRHITWSATPTRASRAPSRTACCSTATPTWCSRA